MRVKNIRKNSPKEPEYLKSAAAIYRGLIIRLNSEKKKT